VLTGTPIENRIDEIYSIIQFLDPQLFGPLKKTDYLIVGENAGSKLAKAKQLGVPCNFQKNKFEELLKR